MLLLAVVGFVLNAILTVLFCLEITYWWGYIWNVIGTLASIGLLIKSGCVQGIVYRERYENDYIFELKNGVVELEAQTPRM